MDPPRAIFSNYQQNESYLNTHFLTEKNFHKKLQQIRQNPPNFFSSI